MRKFFKNFGKDKQSKSGSGACADYYDYDSDPSKLKKLPKLHQAAWKGDVDKVQEYSKKNPNLLDKFNRTALHLACCQGKTAVIKELLEWKAKTDIVDIEGCTPIMIAVRFKHKPCVAVLVEAKANPNSHDTNEESCLHYAARTDQLDILLLLFRGARPAVNAQNKHGETPLWLAVSCQFIAIARELLQLGADVDIADETGRTPLMMACKIDLREFVYLLLEFTADTELRDANDWLAYDYAMNTKPDGACGKILAEHCARTGTGSLVQGRVVVPTDDSDDNLGAASMQRKGSLGAGSMDSYSKKRALRLAGQKVSLDNGDGRLVADDTPEKREFMLTTSDQSDEELSIRNGEAGDSDWDSTAGSDSNMPRKPILKLTNLKVKDGGDSDDDVPDLPVSPGPMSPKKPVSATCVTSPAKSDSSAAPSDVPNGVKVSAEDESNTPQSKPSKPSSVVLDEQDFVKRMMASLGISDLSDSSDSDGGSLNDPESIHEPDPPPGPMTSDPMTSGQVAETKVAGDSEWDSTAASDVNTPRGVIARGDVSTPRDVEELHMDKSPVKTQLQADDWDSSNEEADDEEEEEEEGGMNCPMIPTMPTSPPPTSPVRQVADYVDPSGTANQGSAMEPDIVDESQTNNLDRVELFTPPPQYLSNVKEVDSDEWDSESEVVSDNELAAGSPVAAAVSSAQQVFMPMGTEVEPSSSVPISPPSLGSPTGQQKGIGGSTDGQMKSGVFETKAGAAGEVPQNGSTKHQVGNYDDFEQRSPTGSPKKQDAGAAVDSSPVASPRRRNKTSVSSSPFTSPRDRMTDCLVNMSPADSPRRQPVQSAGMILMDDNGQLVNVAKSATGLSQSPHRTQKTAEPLKQLNMYEDVDTDEDAGTDLSEGYPPRPHQRHDYEVVVSPSKQQQHSSHSSSPRAAMPKTMQQTEEDKPRGVSPTFFNFDMSRTNVADDDALSYTSTEISQDAAPATPYSSGVGGHFNFNISNDMTNATRLQDQLRETQRKLDRERSMKTSLENRRKSFEKEKGELIRKLETVTKAKSSLEQAKIDLEAKIRRLEFDLSKEMEQRQSTEVLLAKVREQLTLKEDQLTRELEGKQDVELQMRNTQMEMRTLRSNMKQLEEELDFTQSKLTHERATRELQEKINADHLLQKLNMGSVPQGSGSGTDPVELLNRFSQSDQTDERAKDVEKLKAENYALKMDLDRTKQRSQDNHESFSTENQELVRKIEELKTVIRLNEDALAHASLTYNLDLSKVKAQNEKMEYSLNKEVMNRDKLETDLKLVEARLQNTSAELEKALQARNNTEKMKQHEIEELRLQLQRKDREMSLLKENIENLTHRLSETDNRSNKVENELHISNATLNERTTQLTMVRRELEQRRLHQEALDDQVRKEKEENVRLNTRLESLLEKMQTVQHENVNLKQALEQMQEQPQAGGQAQIATLFTRIQDDYDKNQKALEEKNVSLMESVGQLKEELREATCLQSTKDREVREQQKALSELHNKLSIAETMLQSERANREHMCGETHELKSQVKILQEKLEASRDKLIQAQASVSSLTEQLQHTERNASHVAQQVAMDTDKTKSELEEALKALEQQKGDLHAALHSESKKNEMLFHELEDAKKKAAANQTLAASEVEDTRTLWETEVKSRSKLTSNIAQLEHDKQEAETQLCEMKRKAKKALELKKAAEVRGLEAQEKIIQLQRDVMTLRTQLKSCKKHVKEVECTENDKSNNLDKQPLDETDGTRGLRQMQLVNSCSDKNELEKQMRIELNAKLVEVNNFLSEQEKARDDIDRLRDNREADMRKNFENARHALEEEMQQLQWRYRETISTLEERNRELLRVKELYDTDVQCRDRLLYQSLDKTTRQVACPPAVAPPVHPSYSIPFTGVSTCWVPNGGPIAGKSDTDLVDMQLLQELDRSITRHLEKEPKIDISVPSRPTYTAAESDPYKSNTEYLNTLKRNYFV